MATPRKRIKHNYTITYFAALGSQPTTTLITAEDCVLMPGNNDELVCIIDGMQTVFAVPMSRFISCSNLPTTTKPAIKTSTKPPVILNHLKK